MNSLPDDLGPRLRNSLDHGAPPELSNELVTGAPHRAAPKLTNPRRRIQVAGGAASLLVVVIVAALAVGSGLGSAPLFTAASASAPGSASAARVPADGLMRIWAEYHYHAGAGLSTSGEHGDVYQLERTGSGSQHAATLAAVFGLSGTPSKAGGSAKADGSDPTWTVGSTDGTTQSLQIAWSGTGDWWFSDPAAYPTMSCSAGGAITGSGGSSTSASGTIPPTSPDPVSPPVCPGASSATGPSLAPTGADARSKAQKLFASTGLTVAAGDIQLSTDAPQTTATAYLSLGGVQTALGWGVTWSSAGTIASAYGHLVNVVDRGSRGTISAADAVARLSDSRWYGSAGPKYQGGVRMYSAVGGDQGANSSTQSGPVPGSVASPPTAEPTIAPTDTPTAVPTDTPTDQPTAVPAPPPTDTPTEAPTEAPTPEPAPTGPPIIDVTINKAEPTLLLMWDSHGGAWLVPGYAMRVENGWWTSVVSLVPGVIELPPLPTIEQDGVRPSVGGPGTTDGGAPNAP